MTYTLEDLYLGLHVILNNKTEAIIQELLSISIIKYKNLIKNNYEGINFNINFKDNNIRNKDDFYYPITVSIKNINNNEYYLYSCDINEISNIVKKPNNKNNNKNIFKKIRELFK